MTDENLDPDDNLNELVMQALMHYDECLRTGRIGDTMVLVQVPGFQEHFELGQRALNELEAAIPRSSKVRPSWAPDKIGRFKLHSVLGSGGFAVVYLAEDPLLDRMVALKVPRPHALVDADLRRRFVVEAQAAAKLDHANIVPVYEAGQDRDLPYIACAWCAGPTLAAWMASRTSPLKPDLAATIIRQLATALQCSHEHGILHRDIKPGNILLFPQSSGISAEFPYIPRLGDFGLAKLMESGELDTVTSQLVGTPRFMAPELLNEPTEPSDAAADIYALGAVLYCLIVGQPPFGAATAAETFRLISECNPVTPVIMNPGIGRDLSRICMKCLDKSPLRRYLTAAEFADDLDRYLSGKPVLARSTSLPLRIQKWCVHRPMISLLLLTSGCLVAALLILAVSYTSSLRTLQGRLESRNKELNQRVAELDTAVKVADSSTKEAVRHRQIAEQLLFVADVQHASQTWKKGDVRETVRILAPYAVSREVPGGIYGPERFAWRFLWNRATTSFRDLYDSKQSVWWMQPSPDGKQLIVCGSAGQLQFLAIDRAFAMDRTLNAGSDEIGCVVFSDDMQLIATASDGGLVRIYNQQTLELKQTIETIPGKKVFVVLFLPGSHQFVACGQSNLLTLCDADTGESLRQIETPFDGTIEFITLSPDRSRLLASGADGRIVQLNLDDFSVIVQRQVSNRTIPMTQYSADGKNIACVGMDNQLHVLDADTEEELLSWQNLDAIHTVLMTPDNYVVIGDRGGVLSTFRLPAPGVDLHAQQWVPSLRWAGHDSPISATICLIDAASSGTSSSKVISADRNGKIWSWDIVGGIDHAIIPPNPDHPHSGHDAVCMTHEDSELHRSGPDGIEVFDLNSGKQTGSCLTGRNIATICSGRLSKSLIAGDLNGMLLKCSGNRDQDVVEIPIFSDSRIERLMVDDKAEYAVAVNEQHDMAVVDILGKTVVATLTERAASAISPDGQWIAAARHGQDDVEVFNRETMRLVATLPAHHSTIEQVLFSPNGQFLVTTSSDRMVTVWSCQTWKLLHKLSGHQSDVTAARISFDNRTLATGDSDGLIKLWDLPGGRQLLDLDQQINEVCGLQFTSSGENLIAWDSKLKILNLQNPKLAR